MILNKADVSTNDDQVETLTKEFNIQYRVCIISLLDLVFTRADLSFAVDKLAKFPSNPGKLHF